MPGVGVGGLLSGLFNPGLDDRLAAHITPNPNPLAQQGQGPQPGTVDALGNPSPSGPPPGSNLAPAAVTQPDPANAANIAALTQPSNAYAADMLRAHRMDALSADLNRNLEGVAAGFGTAQQQASKQNALRAGGGGVGDSLAALKDIQGMQDTTITDNEKARFMANAATFAQTLSQSLGRPVSVQEATEMMNNPDTLKMATGAAGANMQTPDKLKEADAEARAWADAHPNATPQEIAQHKSDFLQQTAGGLSGVGKELAEDRRNYMASHPGATFAQMVADKPELADETSYAAIKGEQAKTTAAAGQERLNSTETFPTLDPQYQNAERIVDWLKAHPEATARAVHWGTAAGGPVGQIAGTFGVLDQDTKDARGFLDQLNDVNFRSGLANVKNVRSQTEANKVGGSVSNLDKRANSDQTITDELNRLSDIAHTARANLLAAAGKRIPAKYTGLADSQYLTQGNPLYNGATQEKVDFSKMSKDDADRAWEALPPGTVFTDTDGSLKRKPW